MESKGRIFNKSLYMKVIAQISSAVFLTLISFAVDAETPELIYKVEWKDAGYQGEISTINYRIIRAKDHGVKGDGINDDTATIEKLIQNQTSPVIIYFTQGTYLIKKTIKLKDAIVIKGSGSNNTHFKFDLPDNQKNCIEVVKYSQSNFTQVHIDSDISKESIFIKVNDGSLFNVGDFAEIEQCDCDPLIPGDCPIEPTGCPELNPDPNSGRPEWNENDKGQLFKIVSKSGNILEIYPPLNDHFEINHAPKVRKINVVSMVGIEDLLISRVNSASTTNRSNILFRYASNCWVRRVESQYSIRSHIQIDSSIYIEVRDSYFHESHKYGDSGFGYGVECGRHTTLCLIENNIFKTLRHAIIVQVGANGNVFGYNYSLYPVQGEDPENLNIGWIPCDISVHGNWAFMNLFESNIVRQIVVSDYHGTSGPGNTMFRNRVECEQGYNIEIKEESDHQNVIGNILVGGQGINISNAECYIFGNRINDSIPENEHDLPNSYYLKGKPKFYRNLDWPSLGADKCPGICTIPAKKRYDSGNFILFDSQCISPILHLLLN